MSVYVPKRKDGIRKSPYYHFDFVIKVSGISQRFCGSTGQKTRAAADRVESRMRELAALGKLGNLITVAAACERYWDEVGKRARTTHAQRQQRHCMDELRAYYGDDTPLVAITSDHVAKAAAKRLEAPISRLRRVGDALALIPTKKLPTPATVNRQVIQPMRRLLRRAKKHWKIPLDIDQFQWGGQDGLLLQEPEGRVRELSTAEELAFWESLEAAYHDICEMYIINGSRQSNWLMLPKSKVDLTRGGVIMKKLKKRSEGEHFLELTPRELEIVTKAYDEAPDCVYLFTAPSGRKRDRGARRPITARMLYNHVTRAFKAAGITNIRPHDFRHTFGSRALRGDPNLKRLQEAMGHSSISSTIRYVHVLQGEVTNMRAGVTVTKTAPPNVVKLKKAES